MLLQSLATRRKDPLWLAAADKFKRHLWYLCPESLGFAFFDDGLEIDIKNKMVAALNTPSKRVGVKRAEIDLSGVKNVCISNFVNTETRNLFARFKLATSFLDKDASSWKEDQEYQDGQRQRRY